MVSVAKKQMNMKNMNSITARVDKNLGLLCQVTEKNPEPKLQVWVGSELTYIFVGVFQVRKPEKSRQFGSGFKIWGFLLP